MSTTFTYRSGAELPGLTLPWQEETAAGVWTDLDLTSGYTFSLTLALTTATTAALVKTTGITGYDGGVTIDWAAGELALPAGTYVLGLRATSGTGDRDYRPGTPITIVIKAAPLPAP